MKPEWATMEGWVIVVFVAVGACVTCGLGGAVVADIVGIWSLPVAGVRGSFRRCVNYLCGGSFSPSIGNAVCTDCWWHSRRNRFRTLVLSGVPSYGLPDNSYAPFGYVSWRHYAFSRVSWGKHQAQRGLTRCSKGRQKRRATHAPFVSHVHGVIDK